MIKTTLGTLADAEPTLTALGTKKLPVKSAYTLAKLAKLVKSELQLYHEKRNEFIVELGEQRETTPEEAKQFGRTIHVLKEENAQEFFKRMSELSAIEISLAHDAIAIDALSTIELTPDEVDRLGPLIKMD